MMEKEQMQLVALPVYREYISILNYYRKDYDYFKYGLSKCNMSTFEKRGDWNLYWRLLSQFPSSRERIALFAANLHDKSCLPMHLSMTQAKREQTKFLRMMDSPVETFSSLFLDKVKKNFEGRLDHLFTHNKKFQADVTSMSVNEVAFFEAVTGLYSVWAENDIYLAVDKEKIEKISKFFKVSKEQKQEIIKLLKEETKQSSSFADLLSQ